MYCVFQNRFVNKILYLIVNRMLFFRQPSHKVVYGLDMNGVFPGSIFFSIEYFHRKFHISIFVTDFLMMRLWNLCILRTILFSNR